jgi:5,10-methenyltetrahydrofolate synthetase
MKKMELREKYKDIRSKIEDKDRLSFIITEKVINKEIYVKSNVIAIYVSMSDEVDTTDIIMHALKSGKTVCVPIIKDTIMNFYKIDSFEELVNKNNIGVKEPVKNINKLINPSEIDLIIVPGICFDLENSRVGFGKGYYDRYLNNEDITCFKLGICYFEQLILDDLIDFDVFDIKMDMVICN